MRIRIGFLLALILAASSFGQGTVRFDNRVVGTSTSAVVAPVYGPDPSDPTSRKFGNGATGPTAPVPTGTQTYGGAPVTGSGFTAGLWARPAGSSGPFVFAASTPFRVTTTSALFGFWQAPPTAVTLSNVPSDPAIRAEIIIRVWDNWNGTITSWDQIYDPATGLRNSLYYGARGESLPFIEADQLGGTTAATLRGLQSFQLYAPDFPDPNAPEPSALALMLLGGAGVVGIFRRSRR